MLKNASDMMHSLATQLNEAQEENKSLRMQLEAEKAASAGRVTLEKVACSQEKVDLLVSTLVSHHMLDKEHMSKVAAALRANPDNILDVAVKAIKLSEWPEERGRGIKSASNNFAADTDEAGHVAWDRMLGMNEATY